MPSLKPLTNLENAIQHDTVWVKPRTKLKLCHTMSEIICFEDQKGTCKTQQVVMSNDI